MRVSILLVASSKINIGGFSSNFGVALQECFARACNFVQDQPCLLDAEVGVVGNVAGELRVGYGIGIVENQPLFLDVVGVEFIVGDPLGIGGCDIDDRYAIGGLSKIGLVGF